MRTSQGEMNEAGNTRDPPIRSTRRSPPEFEDHLEPNTLSVGDPLPRSPPSLFNSVNKGIKGKTVQDDPITLEDAFRRRRQSSGRQM